MHETGDTDFAQTGRHNNEVVRITTATAGALAAAALGLAGTDSAGQRINPTQFDTVYVDISCPPRNNS